MSMDFGSWYMINCCDNYPIKVDRIKALIEELKKKADIVEMKFWDVPYSQFEYNKAADCEYRLYTVAGNAGACIGDNILVEVKLMLHNGLEAEIGFYLIDENYYEISLMFSDDDLNEFFKLDGSDSFLYEVAELFYTILNPIYGIMGEESSLSALKDEQLPDIIGEILYLSKSFYGYADADTRRRCEKILNKEGKEGYYYDADFHVENVEEIVGRIWRGRE